MRRRRSAPSGPADHGLTGFDGSRGRRRTTPRSGASSASARRPGCRPRTRRWWPAPGRWESRPGRPSATRRPAPSAARARSAAGPGRSARDSRPTSPMRPCAEPGSWPTPGSTASSWRAAGSPASRRRSTGTRPAAAGGPGPRRLTVRARQVVVAAGALRSPAILIRSGLGHPAIGRNLRLHPVPVVAGPVRRSDRDVERRDAGGPLDRVHAPASRAATAT